MTTYYDYKTSVEARLNKAMQEHDLVAPRPSLVDKYFKFDNSSKKVNFANFVEMVVYNTIVDYLENEEPYFADGGEANYYEDHLFPRIYEVKVNDQIDLNILHFKYALLSLLRGKYIDIEALAANPMNLKYAIGVKLVDLGLVKDKRTITKILSGDVSLNIITKVLHAESLVDEVSINECYACLRTLAKYTYEEM